MFAIPGGAMIGSIMKRKIAAIMAADIAGYSRLVAEDEEETLRRLQSCRAVFDEYIARFSGRIFNTAGDAIMAEFSSCVEAVRCAIDLQESLRTRNLAYPASRQMSFRVGITVGDVVEQGGDLLGDGVNVAARLAGLAQPGGVCVSRTVHEQVASKLSVAFIDIGAQEVKNLPAPIHAYAMALGALDPRLGTPAKRRRRTLGWVALAGAGVTAAAIAGMFYFTPARELDGYPPAPAETETAPPGGAFGPAPVRPPLRRPEALVPEAVPFISDRQRNAIRAAYLPAPDHKAIAISFLQAGFITDQKDDDTAALAALAACQRLTDSLVAGMKCNIYAIGNTVVSPRGHPPVPPEPWVVRDPSIEMPFAADAVPLVNDAGRANLQRVYQFGRRFKAAAISPQGIVAIYVNQAATAEAARRALENCGARAGAACLIVALDDSLVVPVPATMKATGIFQPARSAALAPAVRDDVARRLADARNGWKAVAAGAGGLAGLMLGAASEREAADGAIRDCARQDRACRVIAIGPFTVEPR